MPLIRERLSAGSSVSFTPSGVSMRPMLRPNRDTVTLSPLPEGGLKRYDLPLYQRDNGRYVLHRIVGVNGEGLYTCLGDNHIGREPNVRHDQMIALVTSFNRGGKEIPVSAWRYRMYCVFWYRTRIFRRIFRYVLRRLGIRRKNWTTESQ